MSNKADSFAKAASLLDGQHGFGGGLWDAQMRSAFASEEKIRAVADLGKRNILYRNCLHELREELVGEIRKWAPKYVQLAAAYPEYAKNNAIDWARERMQKIIDERLRTPDLNGAVAFCLIAMSGGNVLEKEHWRAPTWMCRPAKAGKLGDSTSVIRNEHRTVASRLDFALNDILAKIEIDLAIADGEPEPARDAAPEFADPPAQLSGHPANGLIRSNSTAEFRRSGGVWHLAHPADKPDSLPHQVGFLYICELLKRPYAEISAESLSSMTSGIGAKISNVRLEGEELSPASIKNDAIADGVDTTVESYRREARKIAEELTGGEISPERRAELRANLEAIEDQLRDLTFRGKPKLNRSHSKKASDRVGKALDRALKAIRQKFPHLAEHLQGAIQSGSTLSYRPDVRHDWTF